MKITEARLHDLIRQVTAGEISFSRMVEIINEETEASHQARQEGGRKTLDEVKDEVATIHNSLSVKEIIVKYLSYVDRTHGIFKIEELINEIAELYLASNQSEQGWVDVKTALPEKTGWYLTYSVNGGVQTELYEFKESRFLSGEDITHWMYRPEPPTQTNN